ncbi:flagellar filament capping protein FliD [Campylobacter hyointestinalis]|uniref:flagellar filament capping protein FliD n=1 Tax=Campylobacter hyointestinalis TaxID=198 RepID=UPI0025571906|nr:flagellar filament capping protein FliD [Campylobacter hyointestinalis]MDL2347292.1 flagellar filament capping protein FliD [Campylobacter hyointestinalis]MDL2349034.1 flagellar filament capping protein FliD [Campylobacter hyointestinalis]MDL2350630.1 flagellar filament capping protein FliD [Campylobacter hyointestinalis]MDM1026611.1 flagellar filament capping protein FliD [Campylobacter hyointestinalis]MDM1028083.1 flagellar filament capping protein FliD [Campylobacter hyointestinalis]
MAVGSITALGVFGKANGGSNSVLTQELIDSLKKVDETNSVNPITSKITTNQTKQTDLTTITTLLSSFKTSVSLLTDSSSYMAKKVSNTGSNNATISVNNGVNSGNISIKVNQLATKDSYQSKTFSMSNEPILSGVSSASFNISINGKNYAIEADSSTSLDDIAKQINEKTDGKINAKVLNVGGENPYRLVFSSSDSGSANKIDFSYAKDDSGDTENSKKLLNALGFYFEDSTTDGSLTIKTEDKLTDDEKKASGAKLSSAGDAKFDYNGIEITRSTNTITDLQLGVTINLNKVDKKDEYTNFNIIQDTAAVTSSIQNMITSYNTLINNLEVATSYNEETKTSGTFQGVSEIVNIKTSLNKIINGVDSNGKSLQDFGLSLSNDGLLTLDSAKLKDKLENDFDNFQSFFSTATKYTNVSTSSTGIQDNVNPITGKLKINDKEIDINLTGNDKTQKTKELLKAITNAGITDITASLNTDGNLVLKGVGGANLKLEGDDSLLKNLGFTKVDLKGSTSTTTGFFEKLKDTLNSLTGTNGTLTKYSENLINEKKKLDDEKEKTQNSINEKYERMQTQFAQYEVILNKLNNQMNTLSTMIQMATKDN